MSVESKYYLHESDRAALKALRTIPGFHQLTKAFMKVWQERQFRIVNMSSRVRINEKQLSEYYDMLPPICDRLGIEIPELYLELDVEPNSYTYGDTKPFVVLTSGLLEAIPHELVPTVLAHECGHIACHHTLYRTMGSIVFGAASGALAEAMSAVPFGGLATLPIEIAFSYWSRCSEYSADRAAVICDGTADKMSDVCLRLAGFDKSIAAEANKQEFMSQAMEYRKMVKDSKWDKTLEFLLFSNASHPLMAVRALECEEWAASEQYQAIVDGSYLLQEDSQDESGPEQDVDEASEPHAEDGHKRGIRLPKAPKMPARPKIPWGQRGERAERNRTDVTSDEASAAAAEIREFKALLDEGLITEEEFEAKKRQLLGL